MTLSGRPGPVNWPTVLTTFAAVVTSFIAVGGLVWASGWNSQATVSQIAALNTLVATTAQASKTLNDATNANLAVVKQQVDSLTADIHERRAEAVVDQLNRDKNINKRFDDENGQYGALLTQIGSMKGSVERLAAAYCFLSAQASPAHNSADCARSNP